MKFSEQMTLIAKGYSKKEIDELKKLEAEELAANEAAAEESKETPDPESKSDDATEDKPDYEKLYNELNTKYSELENTLKDIQKAKTKENAAPAADQAIKEQEDALVNIAKAFM